MRKMSITIIKAIEEIEAKGWRAKIIATTILEKVIKFGMYKWLIRPIVQLSFGTIFWQSDQDCKIIKNLSFRLKNWFSLS